MLLCITSLTYLNKAVFLSSKHSMDNSVQNLLHITLPSPPK